MAVGIQKKRKELTFRLISNWKKPFGLYGLYKNISALYTLEFPASNDGIYFFLRKKNIFGM